ncbi:class I SAM-dependent methyltransferase [Arenicella chitinivorans]|nr:class I SAM-dependent methyltransferase [Arenicella chitinivorans]
MAVSDDFLVRENVMPVSDLRQRADRMIEANGFLGVPQETFETAGRSHFVRLLEQGLCPESKVLEIGCGCLRIGYWLIRFLDTGGYAGFDPARKRIEHGRHFLFEPKMLLDKQPRFNFNAEFDTGGFAEPFDYFLACSIWTHCSKRHIQVMLDGFLENTVRDAKFIVSYLPPLGSEDDYQGDLWVGTSHESTTPGIVRHSLVWIQQQCKERGLVLTELDGMDCDSQFWLRIERQR